MCKTAMAQNQIERVVYSAHVCIKKANELAGEVDTPISLLA